MKQYCFAISLALIMVSELKAQVSAVPQSIRATNTLQRLTYLTPSDLVYGIPMPEKRLVGDPYLNEKWKSGSLLLYSTEKLVEGYPIRLDLLRDEIELKTKSGIKVIEGRKIKSFVWVDTLGVEPQYFINGREYKGKGNVPYEGFFEILVDGKLPLFKHSEALIKKANYSVALSVGERDDKIIKKQKLYYASNGIATPLPVSKKKLLPIFGEKRKEVEKFIEKNNLVPDNEGHLKHIFEFYNSL